MHCIRVRKGESPLAEGDSAGVRPGRLLCVSTEFQKAALGHRQVLALRVRGRDRQKEGARMRAWQSRARISHSAHSPAQGPQRPARANAHETQCRWHAVRRPAFRDCQTRRWPSSRNAARVQSVMQGRQDAFGVPRRARPNGTVSSQAPSSRKCRPSGSKHHEKGVSLPLEVVAVVGAILQTRRGALIQAATRSTAA
jgi:hypothetical protein